MKVSILKYLSLITFLVTCFQVKAQMLSEQMAATVMTIWKDSLNLDPSKPKPVKWAYDQGVILEGIDGIWKRTGRGEYFKYIQKSMDFFVTKDGLIKRYKQGDYNIDHVKNGRSLLTLYKVTGQQKYFKAATLLWNQLQQQPRTKEGGFWHKKIYPNQMWLDGLYMGEPFYAEYAAMIKNENAFDDIANQFIWMEKNARDLKTGLMYHGWDESKTEQWADKTTGRSPHFWGRAMGWYGMALVDVLDNFPLNHPKRKELLAILNRYAVAIQKVQDPRSGLWYDILDMPKGKGNYHEASASNMFVYTFAKAVRMGYLPKAYLAVAAKGYKGIITSFVERVDANKINLNGTVSVSGLGGKPYRDGSYDYYLSEKVVVNDPKGVGAFLLAANEMELAAMPKPGIGKTVLLDSYFNNETKTDQSGNTISWHYKWNEQANGGFSFLKGIFNTAGFRTNTLYQAPTAANLKSSSIYIIVDPDFEKENPKPNFVTKPDIDAITAWVNAGGVLVLMANDAPNAELEHFNELASKFGVFFNGDSKGTVPVATNFETAKVDVPADNEIFKNASKLFIKEYSSLKLTGNAKSILKDAAGDNVMSVTKMGKGTVYVIGDPWLYNEYVDGRKLPAIYDNFKAATDLVNWLSSRTVSQTDSIADKMLIYQLSNGAWPKQLTGGYVVNYETPIDDALMARIKNTTYMHATIDNKATSREINALVKAFKATNNKSYLTAAEKGIDYLLEAQYDNGGWPQYYPDKSSYRAEITYNDNAIVNVLNIMFDIAHQTNDFEVVNPSYRAKAKTAYEKGLRCILKTQVLQNGKLSIWAAQYDQHTLKPAKARSFEPASLSTSESVAIVKFLMRIKNPDPQIKNAINKAIAWFNSTKIEGYRFDKLPDGKDRGLIKDPNSTIWARFYDFESNKPIFGDRDNSIKDSVGEISFERRNGYAWYGSFATKLLAREYPKWQRVNQ